MSLRDALEKLAEEWRYKGEFGWGPWQMGEGPDPEILDEAAGEIRKLLAAHPVEPAECNCAHGQDGYAHSAGCPAYVHVAVRPVKPLAPTPDRQPSDAAVEAALDKLEEQGVIEWDHVRAALEAAYRVDVPRPQVTREQIRKALTGKPIVRSADKPQDWRGGLSPEEIEDIATALLNGSES